MSTMKKNKIVFLNPNSTVAMTTGMVRQAEQVLSQIGGGAHNIFVQGITNVPEAPASIQGPADGQLALEHMQQTLFPRIASDCRVLIVGCFDDIGLSQAREYFSTTTRQTTTAVLSLGQSAYLYAGALLGRRFSVVTTVPQAVPVIEENLRQQHMEAQCAAVRATGIAVLELEGGAPHVMDRIVQEIQAAVSQDGVLTIVLGCAGMGPLKASLEARIADNIVLIDPIEASTRLALSLL